MLLHTGRTGSFCSGCQEHSYQQTKQSTYCKYFQKFQIPNFHSYRMNIVFIVSLQYISFQNFSSRDTHPAVTTPFANIYPN